MSVLEVYETAESLRTLKHHVPLATNVIRCLVVETIATRPREFVGGVVFTAVGVLRIGQGASANSAGHTVRINFYDDWAHGASFMDKGDVIILKGFSIVAPTDLPSCVRFKDTDPQETVLVALPRESALRVLQPEEHGDTMEVAVTPENFESPHIRVLPRLDHSNRVFINEIRKRNAAAAF